MNEDKKTNTGGLDTAPDFENFEKADVSEELLEEANGKYRGLPSLPRFRHRCRDHTHYFLYRVCRRFSTDGTAQHYHLLHVGADFPLVPHNEKKQV